MVPEAPLERSEHGLVPGGAGWFVLNLREARWWNRGLGFEAGVSGRGDFRLMGLGIQVLQPGEAMAMYHWESDQEDFLLLAGEALAIVEGEERPLRRWDLLHCPPGTRHAIVGAGDGACVVFAAGCRVNHTYITPEGRQEGREDGGAYTVDDAALRHGAGAEEETTEAAVAYARFRERFPEPEPLRYREGWLPG